MRHAGADRVHAASVRGRTGQMHHEGQLQKGFQTILRESGQRPTV